MIDNIEPSVQDRSTIVYELSHTIAWLERRRPASVARAIQENTDICITGQVEGLKELEEIDRLLYTFDVAMIRQ